MKTIQTKHNPDYKLVATEVKDGNNYLELVWGITNDGENEGLEVYYKKERNGHFYTSRRFTPDNLPKKYKHYNEQLSSFLGEVEDGHKLIVTLG